MKKIFWAIVLILVIIIIIVVVNISNNNMKQSKISEFNSKFDTFYKNNTLYGADVLTIINKAIDNNKEYDIEKDDEGYYIDDDNYCIQVEITLLTTDEKGEKLEVKRKMERLEKARTRQIYRKFFINCI